MTDALITWVDGKDPEHAARREKHLQDGGQALTDEAVAEERFVQHEELRYCLRSIINHAPWIDRVFIITDRQKPDFIDLTRARECGIHFRDHTDIFTGYEHFLPTFNSLSIETMMWRLDELTDNFIYLNDDVFFCRPSKESDFFRQDTPIPTGNRKTIPPSATFHQQGLINAAYLVRGDTSSYFQPEHTVMPLKKSEFEKLARTLGERFFNNGKFPFRDETQFQPAALLFNHLMVNGIKHREAPPLFNYKIRTKSLRANSLGFRIRGWLFRNGWYKTACLNDLQSQLTACPKLMEWLDKTTGPAAPFELGINQFPNEQ